MVDQTGRVCPHQAGGAGQVRQPNRHVGDARLGKQGVGGKFDALLQEALTPGVKKSDSPGGIRFSAHAQNRLLERKIAFSPAQMQQLERAVEQAAGKGAKDSLVLMGDLALVVSVKNRTVVTAMNGPGLKENVFTNIDSAVIT